MFPAPLGNILTVADVTSIYTDPEIFPALLVNILTMYNLHSERL